MTSIREAIEQKKLNPDEPWGVSGMTYKEAIDKYGDKLSDLPHKEEPKRQSGPAPGGVAEVLGGGVSEQFQGVAALAALKRIQGFADARIDLLAGFKDSAVYLPAYLEAEGFSALIDLELDTLTPKEPT